MHKNNRIKQNNKAHIALNTICGTQQTNKQRNAIILYAEYARHRPQVFQAPPPSISVSACKYPRHSQ